MFFANACPYFSTVFYVSCEEPRWGAILQIGDISIYQIPDWQQVLLMTLGYGSG